MKLDRRTAMFALAAASIPTAWAQEWTDAELEQVLAGAQRSAANRTRDPARHPEQTLRFFGLQKTQTVIEVSPGGGWYTEILAPYLRERGLLYAAHESADDPDAYRRNARGSFDAKLARSPQVYDRVRVGLLLRDGGLREVGAAGAADLVLTFRNVHNWIEAGHLQASLQAFHAALKPGGVLGVEEHRAPPGSSVDWIKKNGYVTEDLLIEQARAAGFVLQARSEVNANPRDSKDYPHGVWSLPPTLRGGDVDRQRLLAIGESDRFTHRYVKV